MPLGIANLFKGVITSDHLMAVLEGVIRIAIFIIYIKLVSRMEDIRRTFMYHGAEHKCINCVEHGHPLTVKYDTFTADEDMTPRNGAEVNCTLVVKE